MSYNNITNLTSGLSDVVQNYEYAANRKKEIADLIECIKNPVKTKLVFQNLPRHMRRRTMTHNAKRLPRRFRAAHISQMRKSGLPKKLKRPSRKYRRKPNNLMKEYIRRQRSNIWLETHIWHAKRFHMVEKYGYKLPLAPCDKSFRACYRATTKHCLLQDISFVGCLEISGPLDILQKNFERITSRECGLGMAAKMYISGAREGQTNVFTRDSYPYKSIGEIKFIWKPNIENCNTRTIWIFAHAAYYRELVNELIELFNLEKINKNQNDNDTISEQDEPKFMKVYNTNRMPAYQNFNMNIKAIELKDTINRFRLTGPLAQAILTKAFKVKRDSYDSDIIYNEQSEFWESTKNINSPTELPPNMILSLSIEDPRINRPKKRTKAVPEKSKSNANNYYEITNFMSSSKIWDVDFRNNLMHKMVPTSYLMKMRSETCIVPGEKCLFEETLQSVPVLLIQNPGSQDHKYKRLGYGCGWDILIPAGYGISTWMCLIMWGARAGGLRESKSILTESGVDQFLPDTLSGQDENERRYKCFYDTYFRKPINKRTNYSKFSIVSPFKCPWNQLIMEWNDNPSEISDKFYVVRDRDRLKTLQTLLDKKLNIEKLLIDLASLIPVYIMLETRGNAQEFALICLPKKKDFHKHLKNKKFRNNHPIHSEPLAKDANEKMRKKLRSEHKKILKRLRRRRVREKRKKQESSEFRVIISRPMTQSIVDEQRKKMCQLWLPDKAKSIRNQCSREVFGYVTQGGFSYLEAKCCAIGYVTNLGFKQMLIESSNNKKCLVLIRNTRSRNYRIAELKIRYS